MIDTKISWARATWNPWTGCNRVSPECIGCYADALLSRSGRTFNILAPTQTWRTPYQIDAIAKRANRQAICFVCSLSDYFHADADHWRGDAWRVIRDCQNVNFMLLTKRPERIANCLPSDWGDGKRYSNVWMGTTCGIRNSYKRIDPLRFIPCALRFLSIEPLMESVADIDLTGIGWVAVGGMSGRLHKKYCMKMEWAAEVYGLCAQQGIPFLFKQASSIYTERGINSLSLYLAMRAGQEVDPDNVPMIREYPATRLPLLPFVEHGERFSLAEFESYNCSMPPEAGRSEPTRTTCAVPA